MILKAVFSPDVTINADNSDDPQFPSLSHPGPHSHCMATIGHSPPFLMLGNLMVFSIFTGGWNGLERMSRRVGWRLGCWWPIMRMPYSPLQILMDGWIAHQMHQQLWLCEPLDTCCCWSPPLLTLGSPTSLSPLIYPKIMHLLPLCCTMSIFIDCTHHYAAQHDDNEPPGSVCSEFTDLPIHHPISLKQCYYNPHTLYNTAST